MLRISCLILIALLLLSSTSFAGILIVYGHISGKTEGVTLLFENKWQHIKFQMDPEPGSRQYMATSVGDHRPGDKLIIRAVNQGGYDIMEPVEIFLPDITANPYVQVDLQTWPQYVLWDSGELNPDLTSVPLFPDALTLTTFPILDSVPRFVELYMKFLGTFTTPSTTFSISVNGVNVDTLKVLYKNPMGPTYKQPIPDTEEYVLVLDRVVQNGVNTITIQRAPLPAGDGSARPLRVILRTNEWLDTRYTDIPLRARPSPLPKTLVTTWAALKR